MPPFDTERTAAATLAAALFTALKEDEKTVGRIIELYEECLAGLQALR